MDWFIAVANTNQSAVNRRGFSMRMSHVNEENVLTSGILSGGRRLLNAIPGEAATTTDRLGEAIRHAAKVETSASRMPEGCEFLIVAGNPWPDGIRLASNISLMAR